MIVEAKRLCSDCRTILKTRATCHEIWRYDDKHGRATLIGFALICADCNLVHHAGLASEIGYERQMIKQMVKVNRITIRAAFERLDYAFKIWKERSGRKWTIAVARELRSRFPELRWLPGLCSKGSAQHF